MSKTKTNPRNQPRTQADVKRARREGHGEGVAFSVTLMMYVLADKFGFTDEQIARVNQWYNTNAHAIADGDIKYQDITTVLRDEYQWEFDFK